MGLFIRRIPRSELDFERVVLFSTRNGDSEDHLGDHLVIPFVEFAEEHLCVLELSGSESEFDVVERVCEDEASFGSVFVIDGIRLFSLSISIYDPALSVVDLGVP